ncbi:hypothetical protein LINGRAHAP2_LOCUS16561 [Linum grandiflorum]
MGVHMVIKLNNSLVYKKPSQSSPFHPLMFPYNQTKPSFRLTKQHSPSLPPSHFLQTKPNQTHGRSSSSDVLHHPHLSAAGPLFRRRLPTTTPPPS